ncbi:hypothetical protein BDV25DRAFT_169737 [Aspergillus avenaceus]|uniref:Fungal-specific transcription factor domain-containing protein n=1 Tax=Aspergillus avenaceus TaxID=36643 RepID=A0A5N6U3G0_ASPAV|nr:hypothetical protein BDV25DRAFT_169737 [Aspergillus avenaceus]
MGPHLTSKKHRCRAKNGPAFVFVNADSVALGTQDQDARAIVRRQAARSGCKRRYGGNMNHGLDCDRQGSLGQTTTGHSVSEINHWRRVWAAASNPSPAPQPSSTGYEALRVEYNFDLTDLSTFTNVDLGRMAYLSLQCQPTRLRSLLQRQCPSFLSYLPSRFGTSQCLDDAMRCVAAGAGQRLGLPIRAATPFRLYVKALSSLQAAIEDKDQCLQSDVYCATRLLTVYELLGLPESNHWVHHNRGGMKLVELRGPANHKTQFDWMLLKSQGPSIIIDEMYRKEASIFESAEWKTFFDRASETEKNAECRLWWKFFGTIRLMPGILKDIRILCDATLPQSAYLVKGSYILRRAREVHQALYVNHVLYQQQPPCPSSLFDIPTAAESPDRVRLRLFLLYVTLYMCRIEATFAPSQIERATSEVEAQIFAAQALRIERATAQLDPSMCWHLEQRNALAHSVLQTKAEWTSDSCDHMAFGERKAFLAQRWLRWEDAWRDQVLSEELGASKLIE